MRLPILHIVLALLLLCSYGAERLLPCSGSWDVTCSGTLCDGDATTECEASEQSECTHVSIGSEDCGETHDSNSPIDHSDHHCNCPCHTAALTTVVVTATYVVEYVAQRGTHTRQLLHTTLSPPDHVPIV